MCIIFIVSFRILHKLIFKMVKKNTHKMTRVSVNSKFIFTLFGHQKFRKLSFAETTM